MSWVKLKPGESFESLMKRFKKAVERAGILADVRKNEFYEKPSVKRKRKRAAAKKRALKLQKKLERMRSRGTNSNKNFKWNKDHTKKIPMAPPKKLSARTKDFKREFNKKHGTKPHSKPYNKKETKS